jgi:SAM-dependent methyltransferase
MIPGLRRQARDAVDHTYLRLARRTDLPPYSLRCHVGPAEEYERTPAEYVTYFKLLGGLTMDESVLDIGCGTGRFAAELLGRPNYFRGEYRGFDIDRRAIDWATGHVARRQPNVSFAHADIFNRHYNATGAVCPETFRFPYANDEFGFVFAVSVFTHLPADACGRYLSEIRRVMAPGGRSLLSFVLLDEASDRLDTLATRRLYDEVLVANGLQEASQPGVLHHLDGYSTLTPTIPEILTIYERSQVEKLVGEAGLSVEAVFPGTWANEDGGPAFQDLVLLVREPGGAPEEVRPTSVDTAPERRGHRDDSPR